jgi:hypothetical protein
MEFNNWLHIPNEIQVEIILESLKGAALKYYAEYFFPSVVSTSILTKNGLPFHLKEWCKLRIVSKGMYKLLTSNEVLAKLNLVYFLVPENTMKHGFRSWLEKGRVGPMQARTPTGRSILKTPNRIVQVGQAMRAIIALVQKLEQVPKTRRQETDHLIWHEVRGLLINNRATKLQGLLLKKETSLTITKRKIQELTTKKDQSEKKVKELHDHVKLLKEGIKF